MKRIKGILVCSIVLLILFSLEPVLLLAYENSAQYVRSFDILIYGIFKSAETLMILCILIGLYRIWKSSRLKTDSFLNELSFLQRDLDEKEIRYQSLVSNVPGVTFRCSVENWVMTFISDEMENLSGYPAGQFIGENSRSFESIMHPDDVMHLRDIVNDAVSRGGNFNAEYRIIHRDGTVKWVYEKGLGITDDQGNLLFLDGVIVDVSDIRFLRNYMQSLINSMPSVIIGIDAMGKITHWNSKSEKLTGLSSSEALGRFFTDVLPSLDPLADQIIQAVSDRMEIHIPRKLDSANGYYVYEEITVFPLIAEAIEGAVIRIDDVTRKFKLEEIIVQNDKMLSVGGLAAGMAHELNNPLGSLIQTANVMGRRLDFSGIVPINNNSASELGIDPELLKKYLDSKEIPKMIRNINESGLRMSLIVNDMLGFARKSSNVKSSHHIEEIVLSTLKLIETDFDMGKEIDFNKIEILREFDENIPPVVCERNKIQQVMLNLLRNSYQALSETEFPAPRITIRLYADSVQREVVLEVEDNGHGMEEEVRKRVFEPFFTTRPEGIGAGLGLSVSYFIIAENHGGEMAVESSPGTGARFIIRLPAPE